MRIPVSTPVIGHEEITSVLATLNRAEISGLSPVVEEFERKWAENCGRRFGIAVSSGTAALQVALSAIELDSGSEIIMPAFTIISCPLAALYTGNVPALVDVDPDTWTMDIGMLDEVVGPRTRAIMPVHMYGHPVAMGPLRDFATRHGLHIIEDAAQAHGAEVLLCEDGVNRWARCGSVGDVSCFSFYANKLITTGEGGMLLTDCESIARRARSIRNLSMRQGWNRFMHLHTGHNFRMSGLQAALGVPQIARLPQIIAKKREIANRYHDGLHNLSKLQLPVEMAWAKSVFWMYGILFRESSGVSARNVAAYLAKRGIETRPFFTSIQDQPVFSGQTWVLGKKLPVSTMLSTHGIYLPSGLNLTADEQNYVINHLRDVLT